MQETGSCYIPCLVLCTPCFEMQIVPWWSGHPAGYRHYLAWKAGRGKVRVFCRLNYSPFSIKASSKGQWIFPLWCKGPLGASHTLRQCSWILLHYSIKQGTRTNHSTSCPGDDVVICADGILAEDKWLVGLPTLRFTRIQGVLEATFWSHLGVCWQWDKHLPGAQLPTCRW